MGGEGQAFQVRERAVGDLRSASDALPSPGAPWHSRAHTWVPAPPGSEPCGAFSQLVIFCN